jgi:hypothetical protein
MMINMIARILQSVLVTAIIATLFLAGCKDDSVTPTTDYGFGTITGTVYLRNEPDASTTLHPGSGVLVALRDSTQTIVDSTVTDSSGNWRFQNIQAGTYDCLLNRSGYATTTILGYPYDGLKDETTFRQCMMGQMPAFEVDSLTAVTTSDSLIISGVISGSASYRRYVLLYLGTDSVVSNFHYIRDYYTTRVQPGQQHFRQAIGLSYLQIFYFMDPHEAAWVASYSFVPGGTIGPYGNLYYNTSVGTVRQRVGFIMP